MHRLGRSVVGAVLPAAFNSHPTTLQKQLLCFCSTKAAQSQSQPKWPDVSHGNALVKDDYPDSGLGIDPYYLAEQQPDLDTVLYSGTNHLQKKSLFYRLRHPLSKQIAYMDSEAFKEAYKDLPVYLWYRRGQGHSEQYHQKIRLRCLDNNYRYVGNNPCPICRDEYLWFDFRNPRLLRMFLMPGTLHRIGQSRSGLCNEQYERLKVEVLKAVDTGTLTFRVPHRVYDYRLYYPGHTTPPPQVTDEPEPFVRSRPKSHQVHPALNPDRTPNFDPWWVRWDEFAEMMK